jgi:hypothetical protein
MNESNSELKQAKTWQKNKARQSNPQRFIGELLRTFPRKGQAGLAMFGHR